jgi:hypothetical protein
VDEPVPVQHLRHYARAYPRAWAQADEYRAMKGQPDLGDWPDWCYLPLAGAYAIAEAEALTQGMTAHDVTLDVGNLGALIAWRQTKGVYRFDRELFEAIWNTPLDDKIPVEVFFRLPEWCVWVETPVEFNSTTSPGFFAYLEHDVNTGRPELRLSLSVTRRPGGRPALNHIIFHLTQPTITGALRSSLVENYRQAGQDLDDETLDGFAQRTADYFRQRISLLLYLCTVNSEIADSRTQTKRPMNPQPVRTKKGPRLFAPTMPTTWDVGMRLGAALRRARQSSEQREPTGTHASPRPHVRAAHWHTYRTSKGRAKSVLKWLPPIFVGVGSVDDLPATLRLIDEKEKSE